MDVIIGCDHAGFALKTSLILFLKEKKYQITDMGTYNTEPVDYPDLALAVGLAIEQEPEKRRGILICGSGVGISIAANKIPHVRAAICHDSYSAHQGVEHDNMNVLVLGGRVIAEALACELALYFLTATFEPTKHHVRRLNKLQQIQERFYGHPSPNKHNSEL